MGIELTSTSFVEDALSGEPPYPPRFLTRRSQASLVMLHYKSPSLIQFREAVIHGTDALVYVRQQCQLSQVITLLKIEPSFLSE